MTFADAWQRWKTRVDLDEYETRWDLMEANGQNVHGEADYVMAYEPKTVLDAGCGMGRVGIQLAKLGVTVTGVDQDPDMLERAIKNGPDITWHETNLADLNLNTTFDVVVLAGNVLPFAKESERAQMVTQLCQHVGEGGVLISGASLWPKWPKIEEYDNWCADNGFEMTERYAAWTKEPFEAEIADYAVSTYRRS